MKKLFSVLKKIICIVCYVLFPVVLGVVLVTLFFPSLTLTPVANYLIVEDSLQKADAMFVLAGEPEERAREAAKIHNLVKKIYTTGEIIPQNILAINLKFREAELTKMALIKYGVPLLKIKTIKKATSTYEEINIILQFAKEKNFSSIIIVSSKFHTRRIYETLKVLKSNYPDIKVILRGAPALLYSENKWWESEYGLIFVFQEFVKLFYYEWKYF